MDSQDTAAAAVLGRSLQDRPGCDNSALSPGPDALLTTRVATAPGLVRAGASCWDHARSPIHALTMASAYADPLLLRDLGARGGGFVRDLAAEVVVGAAAVSPAAATLATEAVSTYLQVLDLAEAKGLLNPSLHKLTVDAILNQWPDDDPRWDLLPVTP